MSVRITRKARRVLDFLARGGATAPEISNETNINFATLWPLLDRLTDEGMVLVSGRTYSLSAHGRATRREAEEEAKRQRVANWPDARPRGPRPPHSARPYGTPQTPWPKGKGRPR